MSVSLDFSVGDYLIDSDEIYIVTKVDQTLLHYKPTDDQHQSVTGSIPIGNIISSGFRHLLSKAEIQNFYTVLSTSQSPEPPIDNKLFKDIGYLNQPLEYIPLLLQLNQIRNNPLQNFSGSNKELFENILKHICQEFALVTKQTQPSIRQKILKLISRP